MALPWILKRIKDMAGPNQNVILTLDYYHADEHLNDVANAAYPAPTPERSEWYNTVRNHLWEDEHDAFFLALETRRKELLENNATEAAEVLRHEYNYFQERRDYLNYKLCRSLGLLIGSGMVEGGVRFVGKDRLDGTGMKWNVDGAEDILQLRCLDASNRWDTFFQKRAIKRANEFKLKKTAWLRAA